MTQFKCIDCGIESRIASDRSLRAEGWQVDQHGIPTCPDCLADQEREKEEFDE